MQQQSFSSANPRYYFSRGKDTRLEDGKELIALFAGLTVETPESSACLWADLQEIPFNQADVQLRKMEKGIYTYRLTKMYLRNLDRFPTINRVCFIP